jgi:hypothetical protein
VSACCIARLDAWHSHRKARALPRLRHLCIGIIDGSKDVTCAQMIDLAPRLLLLPALWCKGATHREPGVSLTPPTIFHLLSWIIPRVGSSMVRAMLEWGPSIMLHNLLDMISNPGVAATVLLVGFMGVMAWVWWPAGYLLP